MSNVGQFQIKLICRVIRINPSSRLKLFLQNFPNHTRNDELAIHIIHNRYLNFHRITNLPTMIIIYFYQIWHIRSNRLVVPYLSTYKILFPCIGLEGKIQFPQTHSSTQICIKKVFMIFLSNMKFYMVLSMKYVNYHDFLQNKMT